MPVIDYPQPGLEVVGIVPREAIVSNRTGCRWPRCVVRQLNVHRVERMRRAIFVIYCEWRRLRNSKGGVRRRFWLGGIQQIDWKRFEPREILNMVSLDGL